VAPRHLHANAEMRALIETLDEPSTDSANHGLEMRRRSSRRTHASGSGPGQGRASSCAAKPKTMIPTLALSVGVVFDDLLNAGASPKRVASLCRDCQAPQSGFDTPRRLGAANTANGREGSRPSCCAIAGVAGARWGEFTRPSPYANCALARGRGSLPPLTASW
jgi:hypothetical protein